MTVPNGRPCAIVTGAASGIGAATALQLARAGFNIALNYASNATGAAAVADECQVLGVQALAVRGDIADDGDCRNLVQQVVEAFGRIDVLVNNAGVTRYADAKDLNASNADDFAHIFGVNVTGTFQVIRAAEPYLRRSQQAAIVNVSSHSGMSGDGSSLAYATSKGAINTMTIGLARTLAPQIRVNAVCPGFVDTTWALAWHSPEEYREFCDKLIDIAPLKSVPTAEDIAESVTWFATPASRCVTGQLLVIDSGSHLAVVSPME